MKSVGNCNCGRGAVFSSWGAALAAHGLHFRRPSSAWQPFTGQRRGACVAMPLLSMYINNKAGGLIYHRVRLGAPLRNRRPTVSLDAALCLGTGVWEQRGS